MRIGSLTALFWMISLVAMGQTPLLDAVHKRDQAAARALLDQGANPNEPEPSTYRTPLIEALRLDDTAMAELLLRRGAYLHAWTGAGAPLDHCPSAATQALMLRYLDASRRFSAAAHRNDPAAIEQLVQRGFPIDMLDSLGMRPLYIAADEGRVALVQKLLQLGAKPFLEPMNPMGSRPYHLSPLHAAVQKGHLAIAEALLKAGGRSNELLFNGNTPLVFAIHTRNAAMVQLLLAHGADPNATVPYASGMLEIAAMKQDKAIMEILLAKGAKVPDNKPAQAQMLRALGNLGDLTLFLEMAGRLGLDLTIPTQPEAYPDWNPLLSAAAHDSLALVAYMVEQLHYPLDPPRANLLPLQTAAQHGHVRVVRYLLEHGASATSHSGQGVPLVIAISGCQPEIVELLVAHGALQDRRYLMRTPMTQAVDVNCLPVAKVLLAAGESPVTMYAGSPAAATTNETSQYLDKVQAQGADVCAALMAGNYAAVETYLKEGHLPDAAFGNATLLTTAAGRGDVTGVKLLLRYKADPNHVDPGGNTPLIAAARAKGGHAVMPALVQAGAEITRPDKWQPLMVAILEGTVENVRALLDLGADPNALSHGISPISQAVGSDKPGVVELLLARGADHKVIDAEGRNLLAYSLWNDTLLRRLARLPGMDVMRQDNNRETLLHGLPAKASVATVAFLLEKGIDPNLRNKEGETALAKAVNWEEVVPKVECMLRKGADIYKSINLGHIDFPFLEALYQRDRAAVCALIRRNNLKINPPKSVGNSALLMAMLSRGDLEGYELWIAQGGDINAPSMNGLYPIITAYLGAAAGQDDKLLRAVMAQKPNVNVSDAHGNTPLMYAVQGADSAWVAEFVKRGADVNALDKRGRSVLQQVGDPAGIAGELGPSLKTAEMARWLVAQGANPQYRGPDGMQLLLIAAQNNDTMLARYAYEELHFSPKDTNLLHENALGVCLGASRISWGLDRDFTGDVRLDRDFNDNDYLYLPEENEVNSSLNERLPMIRYLLRIGVPVNSFSSTYGDPVIAIYSLGGKELMPECLAAGYDVNRKSPSGTLLYHAVASNDVETVKLLLQHGADPTVQTLGLPRPIDAAQSHEMRALLQR